MCGQYSGMTIAVFICTLSHLHGSNTKEPFPFVVRNGHRPENCTAVPEQRRHTQARSTIRGRCSRPTMGRKGQSFWSSRVQECSTWDVRFRRSVNPRRATSPDEQPRSVSAADAKREDIQATRHMGTRTNLSSRHACRLQAAIEWRSEQ